jgi:hypothetical protein
MDFRKRVEIIFYLLGLQLVKYPKSIIFVVSVVTVGTSIPLLSSFPTGDSFSPLTWKTSSLNFLSPNLPGEQRQWLKNNQATRFKMPLFLYAPSWFAGMPVAAVQQVLVKVSINCTTHPKYCGRESLPKVAVKASDQLLRDITHLDKSCSTIVHPVVPKIMGWFRQKEDKVDHKPTLSESILSPSLAVNREDDRIDDDSFRNKLLFGGYGRKSAPILPSFTESFHLALTVFLDITPESFKLVESCIGRLGHFWHNDEENVKLDSTVRHVFYEDAWQFHDLFPLSFIYFMVFVYISYSVGKIKQVKSQFGLGITAVLTVLLSLTMSVGICTYFGLNISIRGSEFFPYMVIIFGLENVLVIVKAVISAPGTKDVKFKIAEALKQEGVAIAINYITISVLLWIGCFVFSATMQEFCIIGIVGISSSVFLQVIFFPTVLSIDLLRKEGYPPMNPVGQETLPEIMELANFFPGALSEPEEPLNSKSVKKKISKREKLAYFVANTRPIQKACMVFLVAFVTYYVIQIDIVGILGSTSKSLYADSTSGHAHPHAHSSTPHAPDSGGRVDEFRVVHIDPSEMKTRCGLRQCWYPMAASHWPNLLMQHNLSATSRFITILTPISLGMELGEINHQTVSVFQVVLAKLVPTFHEPYFYGILGALLTLIVFLFFSWCHLLKMLGRFKERYQLRHKRTKTKPKAKPKTVTLKGTNHDIMCLAVDNGCVVSATSNGYLRKWDPFSENPISSINRNSLIAKFLNLPRPPGEGRDHDDEDPTNVVVEREAESPITVKVVGRRMSSTSFAESLQSFSTAHQDTDQSSSKGYDFSQYIDLHSPYTYRMALDLMGNPLKSLSVPRAASIWCMDISEDTVVLGCENGNVEAWNLNGKTLLWRSTASRHGVMTVVASSDGAYAGNASGTIGSFNSNGDSCVSVRAFQTSVSVMRCVNGRLVAGSYDGLVKVFEMSSLRCLYTFRDHLGTVVTMDTDKVSLTF